MTDQSIINAGLDQPIQPENKDHVKPMTKVEQSKFAFIAQVLREYAETGMAMSKSAGPRIPAVTHFAKGWRHAFLIAADLVEQFSAGPVDFADEEKVGDFAEVLITMQRMVFETKLKTGNDIREKRNEPINNSTCMGDGITSIGDSGRKDTQTKGH